MTVGPPSWSGTELDVMRAGLGFVTVMSFASMQFLRPSGEPTYPVGIARVVDLQWLGSRRTARQIRVGAYAAALCYAADLLVPYALLFLTATVILEVTFRCSFGSVNAGYHLLALVLTAQTVATVLWNAAVHWHWDLGRVLASSQAATAAWWSVLSILAVYFTSGCSKLVNTRGRWIARSPGLLLAASARVETDRIFSSESRSWDSTTLVSWLFRRPGITQLLFAVGLFVELCAPIGVLGERVLLLIGVALIALHQANGLVLLLPFPVFQLLVLVYVVNVPQFFR